MENNPFAGRPDAQRLYTALLEHLAGVGEYTPEVKKTSVHLVAGKGAFLGLHPRTAGLLVNIVLGHRLESPRVVKAEQVSKSRYHNEVKVGSEAELDEELLGWIREAYALKGG
jgi:hypothetical protein